MESAVGRNLSISNFKRLPIAFLVSALLFFVSQFIIANMDSYWNFVYLYADTFPEDEGIRIESQLRTNSVSEDKNTVLLIGSSQTREDFDVGYLNREMRETGTVFYNLGFGGGNPINIYMLKNRLLSQKPDIVIEVLFVGSFYQDYSFPGLKRFFYDPAILPDMLRYWGTQTIIDNGTEFGDAFIGMTSVFYRYRESLRRIIASAVTDGITGKRRIRPELYHYTENKPASFFETVLNRWKSPSRRFYISQDTGLNQGLFTQFAEDMISEGVELIVISGPTHPLLAETYDEELDYAYNSFLYNQSQSLGFTYLSKDDLPTFVEGDFIDFTHLNADGRAKMSEFIEAYLEDYNYIPR